MHLRRWIRQSITRRTSKDKRQIATLISIPKIIMNNDNEETNIYDAARNVSVHWEDDCE